VSQVLLGMVQRVLRDANVKVSEIDAVAVGQGPGSFTGLRIGIGVAQGIAYGAGCVMIGVSSLQALAQQVPQDGLVIAGIDARMNEMYWGMFDKSRSAVSQIGQLNVSAPETIALPTRDTVLLVGNAWSVYQSSLDRDLLLGATRLDDVVYPTAESVLALAHQAYQNQQCVSPLAFAPEYVRDNVAKKSQ